MSKDHQKCFGWLALALVSVVMLVWILGLTARPDASLQVTFLSEERFKTRVSVNEELHSRFREKLEQRINGAPFERTIHLPVKAPLVESVRVEVGPVVNDQPVSAAIKHVRLLSATGKVLREQSVSGTIWDSGGKLGLERTPLWITAAGLISTAGLMLASLLMFYRVARKVTLGTPSYALWLGVGLTLSGVVYASVLAWQRGPWMPSERWVNDLTFQKLNLAANPAAPRLLTVGGSSGLYGLSAEELTKLTGRTVLNLSLHAGLPLTYHFSVADAAAKAGDDILLQLEFSYLEEAARLDQWRVEQWNVWAWRGVPEEWFGVSFPEVVIHTPLHWVATGALAKIWFADDAQFHPVEARLPYGKSFFLYGNNYLGINAYGDLNTTEPAAGAARPGAHSYMRGFPFDSSLPAAQALAAYAKDAQAKSQRVYLVFPPTIASELAEFRGAARTKWVDDFISWAAKHGVRVLGRPEMMQQPAGRFLDTVYHLTPTGRQEHTERVANLLREAGWPGR